MCGIVGYIGAQQAQDILLDGLSRLEYRGYDSAGIAVSQDGAIQVCKTKGRYLHHRTVRFRKIHFASLHESSGDTILR